MHGPGEQGNPSGPLRTFLSDLSSSARILKRAPVLVLVTLALHLVFAGDLVATELDRRSRETCLSHNPDALCPPHAWATLVGVLYLPVSLFLIGFAGTQRVWFMRASSGEGMERAKVWRATWSFLGRYLRLAFLSSLLLAPAAIVAIVHSAQDSSALHSTPLGILFYISVFVLDVLGTFVTPALAYSTRRVRAAIPSGIGMLIREWPESIWYAAAPPLTLLVIGANSVRRSFGITSVILIAGVVTPFVSLWTKSATALFYLRRVPPIGPDGAAFLAKLTCPNGHPVTKGARFCQTCGVALGD